MIRPTSRQPTLFEIADDDGNAARRPSATTPAATGNQVPRLTIRRYRLELVAEATSLFATDPGRAADPLCRPEAAARFLAREIGNRPQEHMCALYLDTRNRPLGWTVAHIGTINRAAVEPRAILVTGLSLNAAGFLIAHNHPSGDPTPSAEDLAFTRRMAEAGELIGIRLVDHLILGDDGRWISLKQRGTF